MKNRKIFAAIFILILLVIPLSTASAAQEYDRIIRSGETVHEDVVIFGGSLLIEDGAEVIGDVSVFGGQALINGMVDGDIVIFGGETTVAGSVSGDLVVFGGALHSDSTADVDGDCILIGGTVTGDGGASCTEVGQFPNFIFPGLAEPVAPRSAPDIPEVPRQPELPVWTGTRDRNFFGAIGSAIGWGVLNGILALVIAYVAPNHLGQVGYTLRNKPVAGGVVGVLSMIAIPSIAVILAILSAILTIVCIGLLGWPILLVLGIGFMVALLVGWVAAGNLLGQRLVIWFKFKNQSLPVTAALGTAVLSLAASLLSSLPFWLGGWFWSILAFLILSAGLGSVALTRYGSRPYPARVAANHNKVNAVMETLVADDDMDFPPKSPGN